LKGKITKKSINANYIIKNIYLCTPKNEQKNLPKSMNQLSDRLNALSPSETLAMSQKSNELKAQGIDVINLSVGEPDFNTPDHIKAAAKKAVDDNFSFYSPVPGYPALRNAIADKLKNENGLDYKPEQILCSNGAKQSVCNVLLAIINKGDEVIVPAPYWVSYVEMVKLAEGTNVVVEAGIEQDFKITPAQLEAAITPKTKAIILCSPSNPSGSVYSQEELKGLADVLAKYPQVVVISDEIYEHINYLGKHQSIAQFPEIKERTVIINGVSKAYAMTGWRIGFIAAPDYIVKACNKLQGQYTSGPCSISQKAAEAAYRGTQQPVADMRAAFLRRRDLAVKLLKEIEGLKVNVPDGAFYVFPDVSYYLGKSFNGRKVNTAADLAMYLLEEGHVATVGGNAFGSPTCLRLSYATSDEQITEAVKRIANSLKNLK
jgi:aspartate aminotransferase